MTKNIEGIDYMKKLIPIVLTITIIFIVIGVFYINKVFNNTSTNQKLTTVNLASVTLSPAYAPLYVSINKGFFEDEGIEIDLSIQASGTKIMQNVLTGAIDVGFCGPEQSVLVYLEGKENYLVLFAEENQKNNGFLVSRNINEEFSFENLMGKTIIGSRKGGSQENALEYVLRQNGINPDTDVEIITNVTLDNEGARFKSGIGDYAILFEPVCSDFQEEGECKILLSIGEELGETQSSSFFATKNFINQNTDLIQQFTNAIYKGQLWVANHSSKEIAEVIKSLFPDTSIETLENSIEIFKKYNIYSKTPIISQEHYNRMVEVLKNSDSSLVPEVPDYNKIVNNKFSSNSVNTIK